MSLLQKKLFVALALLLVCQSCINLAKYLGEVQNSRFGGDFIVFWQVAGQAVHGDISAIYHVEELKASGDRPIAPFMHPPHAILLLAPLGKLTYEQAITCWSSFWLLSFYGLVFLVLRQEAIRQHQAISHRQYFIGAAILLPFVMANLFTGQWGTAIASFLLAAYYGWRRHPIFSGISIGLMTVKPHLAILLLLALLVSRQWRMLVIAGATAACLMVASMLWLGLSPWMDYVQVTQLLNQFMSLHGQFDQLALAPFISLQGIGLPRYFAAAVQALITLGVFTAVVQVFWRHSKRDDLPFSLLACGSLLATPYSLCYDSPVLAVVMLPLFMRTWQSGWNSGIELAAFTAVLLMPYAQPLFMSYHIPFGLLSLLMLFAVLYRQYLHASAKVYRVA